MGGTLFRLFLGSIGSLFSFAASVLIIGDIVQSLFYTERIGVNNLAGNLLSVFILSSGLSFLLLVILIPLFYEDDKLKTSMRVSVVIAVVLASVLFASGNGHFLFDNYQFQFGDNYVVVLRNMLCATVSFVGLNLLRTYSVYFGKPRT